MRYFLLILAVCSHLARAALPPSNLIADPVPGALSKRDPTAPPADFITDLTNLNRRQIPGLSEAEIKFKRATEPFNPVFVSQATTSIPLWLDRDPTYYDVVQRKVANCWTQAAALAVVIASPDWITHLFFYKNGTAITGSISPHVSEINVALWDPATRQRRIFPVNVFNQSLTEDRPGDRWWNSAILQGMVQLGAVTDIGGIHGNNGTISELGGSTVAALTALTGYTARISTSNGTYMRNETALYEDLIKASLWSTPILIATQHNTTAGNKFENSVLNGDHAYAVQNRFRTPIDPNAVKTVILQNPWGYTIEANMTDIMDNMSRVVHLENFRNLDWTQSSGQGDGTSSVGGSSTSSAAPQSTTSVAPPPARRRRRTGGDRG